MRTTEHRIRLSLRKEDASEAATEALVDSYDGSVHFFPHFFMRSVNKIMLLGNVTHDAELKNTTGGQSVCTFGLATDRSWKDQSGERKKQTEFHHLVTWGGLAEVCGKSVKKGSPLYVEGYLKTNSWENKEKKKQQRTEVIVENLVFLAPKAGADEQANDHVDEVVAA